MPLPEPSNSSTEGPEKCIIAKVQGKDAMIPIKTMFNDLKEDMNKLFNEDHKNTKQQLNGIIKAFNYKSAKK